MVNKSPFVLCRNAFVDFHEEKSRQQQRILEGWHWKAVERTKLTNLFLSVVFSYSEWVCIIFVMRFFLITLYLKAVVMSPSEQSLSSLARDSCDSSSQGPLGLCLLWSLTQMWGQTTLGPVSTDSFHECLATNDQRCPAVLQWWPRGQPCT